MNQEHHHAGQTDASLKTLVEEKEVLEELLEEVDLEIWAKEGRHPRRAKRYRIKIDTAYYIVHRHEITGNELLVLANKVPPTSFILTQKIRGHGVRTIAPDEIVDLTAKGVERFTTLPREVQEGSTR